MKHFSHVFSNVLADWLLHESVIFWSVDNNSHDALCRLPVRQVYQSYELCCGDGTGVGDGITPLESAFDMAGAKRFIQLEVKLFLHTTSVLSGFF